MGIRNASSIQYFTIHYTLYAYISVFKMRFLNNTYEINTFCQINKTVKKM